MELPQPVRYEELQREVMSECGARPGPPAAAVVAGRSAVGGGRLVLCLYYWRHSLTPLHIAWAAATNRLTRVALR